MKILIVDDELVSRKTLQKLLQNIGDCETAENGEDALAIAMSDTPPDLILLDIIMPGIDGYEVCRKINAEPKISEVPVIFLSANANIEDIKRGFELGAVDYITKPFHKEEVKARVQTHLSIKRMQADLHDKNLQLEQQLHEIQEKGEQLRQKDLQLVEMDRIAGIGTLAAGIAHEINNPLGFVKSSIGFVKKSMNKLIDTVSFWDGKRIPEGIRDEFKAHCEERNIERVTGSMEKKFDSIERGIERIIKIVNSLRRFSRVDMETVGTLNINESIEDAVEILSSQSSGDVAYIKELDDIPTVACSANDINQCLLHVIKNAQDAVEEKGEIRLVTTHGETENDVVIRIIDNGKGMSDEKLRQAFNPFFTTKAVGSGTGVGLSITETIIKRHGGAIGIESKEGEGTTVTITLPVTGSHAEPQSP